MNNAVTSHLNGEGGIGIANVPRAGCTIAQLTIWLSSCNAPLVRKHSRLQRRLVTARRYA